MKNLVDVKVGDLVQSGSGAYTTVLGIKTIYIDKPTMYYKSHGTDGLYVNVFDSQLLFTDNINVVDYAKCDTSIDVAFHDNYNYTSYSSSYTYSRNITLNQYSISHHRCGNTTLIHYDGYDIINQSAIINYIAANRITDLGVECGHPTVGYRASVLPCTAIELSVSGDTVVVNDIAVCN